MTEQKLSLFREAMRPQRPKIPHCCRQCIHFDSEFDEWNGKTYYYCNLNVWLPTKKGTCKKQVKR